MRDFFSFQKDEMSNMFIQTFDYLMTSLNINTCPRNIMMIMIFPPTRSIASKFNFLIIKLAVIDLKKNIPTQYAHDIVLTSIKRP